VSTDVLKIALPSKGRLADPAVALLHQAGMRFRRRARRLYCSCSNTNAALIFANASDVPTLVAEGVVDLGVTGSDLVAETPAELTVHLALGYGRCRLCLAVRENSDLRQPADLSGKTIGTKFRRAAERFLAEHKVEAHLIELGGSLEVMVGLELVDAIVEVVETGDSLRDNHLIEIAEIARSEAVLIGRPTDQPQPKRDQLIRRIEGVVIARQYYLCEYNLPTDKLDQAREITPGFHAPTVQRLDDEGWVAVKVMVKRGDLAETMDRLEALGAEAIFASEMTNCRL